MTDYTVPNLKLTEEELDMLYGMKINAKEKILKVVKRMELCTIPNVEKVSTMLVVVFVLLIVPKDILISEFLVKNPLLTVEVLDMPYLLDYNVYSLKKKDNSL